VYDNIHPENKLLSLITLVVTQCTGWY